MKPPRAQRLARMTPQALLVRTSGDPSAIAPAIRAALVTIAPDLPFAAAAGGALLAIAAAASAGPTRAAPRVWTRTSLCRRSKRPRRAAE